MSTALQFLDPDPVTYAVPQEVYPELAFALAVAETVDEDGLEEFLRPFGLSVEQYHYISQQPAFLRALTEAKAFVAENGRNKGFKVRARYYAERLVDSMYQTAKNNSTDPSLRLKIFESLAKYAELEPTNSKKEGGAGGTVISINIAQGIRGVSDVHTVQIEGEA